MNSVNAAAACPSCRNPMEVLQLQSAIGQPLELDLCFGCHGIWFDPRENSQLSAQSVLSLFKTLHAHRDEAHIPLQERMGCPRCKRSLERGADRTISGPYVVYRCPQKHGRFSTFSSFMVEKGFVRHLTNAEITTLADKVKIIHCSSCGAAVDLRKDHACPYCRSAFSLLDPQAVERALARYKTHPSVQREQTGQAATVQAAGGNAAAITSAEVLIAQERIRLEHERHERERRQNTMGNRLETISDGLFADELWSAGINMVWNTVSRLFR